MISFGCSINHGSDAANFELAMVCFERWRKRQNKRKILKMNSRKKNEMSRKRVWRRINIDLEKESAWLRKRRPSGGHRCRHLT